MCETAQEQKEEGGKAGTAAATGKLLHFGTGKTLEVTGLMQDVGEHHGRGGRFSPGTHGRAVQRWNPHHVASLGFSLLLLDAPTTTKE